MVGVIAGLSAVLFALAIDGISRLSFGFDPAPLRMFLVPVGVSVATGMLLAWVFPDVRGSGVPQTKAAYHLHHGAIPLHVPLGKFITGALCIGSGHSMGREGPSVQIGAGLASVIGRWLALPAHRIRDLIPVGAAGALAAAFNTPVAAVLFALEEIIGDMNASLLGSTVVASVSSVVVARSLLGNQPLFRVPEYHLQHPAELLAYAALGIAGGILSIAFSKGLLSLRQVFRGLPAGTRVIQPVIGGLAIGVLIIFVPQVMGVGYDTIDQALNGGLVFRTMALLCVLKIAATIVSYASGNAGGIFAPSLYIGAMAGGAVGAVVHEIAPLHTADPGAYALVGMGAVFAGIIRAPMTSVFMIFEITQDYQIIVPLMVANLLSFVIARAVQPTPLYHALLQQDDVHLPSGHLRTATTSWSAGDVMTTTVTGVSGDLTVAQALERCDSTNHVLYLTGPDHRLVGAVSREQLVTAIEGGHAAEPVAALAPPAPVHAHADHPFDIVLERMAQTGGVLPIVSRDNAQHVLGIVTFPQIAQYMQRRGRERQRPATGSFE
jgi:CIC family chloride channel protein